MLGVEGRDYADCSRRGRRGRGLFWWTFDAGWGRGNFLARGEHLHALHAHGLHVESIKGDYTIHPVQATDDPAEVGVDVVILGESLAGP